MAKRNKKPILTSMNGKPPGKPYRTGEKNGKSPKSSLDRLALKTRRQKKKKGKAKQ